MNRRWKPTDDRYEVLQRNFLEQCHDPLPVVVLLAVLAYLDLEEDAAVGNVNNTKLFLIYLNLLTVQLN